MKYEKKFVIILGTVCTIVLFIIFAINAQLLHAQSANYFVSPTGNDANTGSSAATPFKTIQKAFDVAQPGATINLAAGTYLQDAISKRNGTPTARITVIGPAAAIVKGAGGARILEIDHDYYTLTGFTIDGLFGSGGSESDYRDKLIYAQGKEAKAGVKSLKILNMILKNGGGECVRLRYFAEDAEIANNTFTNCGVVDFKFNGGGKNGEGVYIGTAPEQRGDGKNPTTDPDVSRNNWVHHNTFNTQGNECVDIKEDATANIVEFNSCTGQKDPNSAGFDSRGSGNIFRNNESFGNTGAGIRFGGDTPSDGTNNDAYANNIHDNLAGGIKFMATPQGKICGNTMTNNTGGNAVGTYSTSFNPTAVCAGITQIPSATVSPSVIPSITPASGTEIALIIGLHGIGTGGDNVNPTSSGNSSPQHPNRQIEVVLYDNQNQLAATVQGTILYNSTSGKFLGVVSVPATVSSGAYIIRIKSPQYLRKTIPGIQTITKGQRNQTPQTVLVTGDTNNDNFLNILDYNLILDCFSDLSPAKNCSDPQKKLATDLTDDGNVNQFDYNLFLRELSVQSGE